MANSTISPNMNLVLPTVGVDPGPDWATNLNASLTIIDQHDHTAGNGVKITPSGMNISSDLPFGGNNATLLRSTNFIAQSAPLALATDIGCLYVSGVDLYYNDENGSQIRITQSGGVVGTPGSISGLVSPATATYVSADSTFVWQSAANTPANMDGGSFIFRNIVSGSPGLTLQPPTLGSNYTLTLPTIPSQTNVMTLDASGNMSSITYDQVGQNMTSVGANAIGASFTQGASIANISGLLVSGGWANNIVDGATAAIINTSGSVTAAGLVSTTSMQVASTALFQANVQVQGLLEATNSKVYARAQTVSGYPLGIIRGSVSAGGSATGGEGFSVFASGASTYVITYNAAFNDTPSVTVSSTGGNVRIMDVQSSSSSGCTIVGSGTTPFNFIAIGQSN